VVPRITALRSPAVDNLTHTLISVMVGEAIYRSTPASPVLAESARRNVAIAVMVIGGNLPDFDVIYTGLAGTKLDYLLHHRGHTHTIIGALILSLLLFVAVRLWWKYRKVEPQPADIRFLVVLSLVAPLLHIGLDSTNSYGVHPFWPVDNRWYYGDAVFIVEPLLWACSAVLLFTLRSTLMRAVIALVLVVGLGLSWFSGLVPASLAVLLTLLTLGLAAVSRYSSPRAALSSGIVAWLVVTAVFVATSRTAKGQVDALLADGFPTARTLDTVLTPAPANPVCREVLAVQLADGRYVVRSAFHSLMPGWIPAGRCAQLSLNGTTTAPLIPTAQASTDEMAWIGEFSIGADVPAALARDYCAVDALLQFARVPWAGRSGDGWLVGDLRYDREPELGIAEIEVGSSTDDCPRLRPPWVPPRQDLLVGS
jgi:inner membrane protein